MKKITLLIILLHSLVGFSQQQQYNLGFESGTPSGILSNYVTFDGPAPGLSIVTNPDPDGVNTSATTKVLKLNMVQGSACYSGMINLHGTLGTWKLDGAVPSNTTLSMKVNKSIVGKVGVKFANTTDGTLFEIKDNQGLVSTVNEWVTLTWNISEGATSIYNTAIDQIVIFIDWRCSGESARPSDVQLLVDDISWGANKLTDAPAAPTCTDGIKNGDEAGVDCGGASCPVCPPSCTDGIKNGDETGVDCGGASCPVCPPSDPTVSAPTPTLPENEVLVVYSDAYTTNKVTNFVFQDFAGNGPNTEIDIQSDGNKTGKLVNLNYYGPRFDSIDLTVEQSAGVPKYNYVHFDYYATSSNEIKFFVIDGNLGACCGDGREPRYTINLSGGDETLVKGIWKSVFIPLSFFRTYSGLGGLNFDGNPVTQLKFEGNGNLFFDNIYFSKSNSLGVNEFETLNMKVYPNPVKNNLKIEADKAIQKISIFSILGQEVIAKDINSYTTSIDTSGLENGVYILKTTIDNKVNISKIVKE